MHNDNDLSCEQITHIKKQLAEYDMIKHAYLIKQNINEKESIYILGVIFDSKEKEEVISKTLDALYIFAVSISDYRLAVDNFTFNKFFKKIIKKKKIADLKTDNKEEE